jgi:MarR family transcriptional regulator, organic hydroperoxide resistance regulator
MSDLKSLFYPIKESWRQLQKFDQLLKSSHDLSLDEAILLCCVSEDCKCQGDIARETGLTPTQASRVLGSLEKKALIERSLDSEDKRKMIFTINSQGSARLEQISRVGVSLFSL